MSTHVNALTLTLTLVFKRQGTSNEEGNDVADKLAGYAQRGGAQNEQDIAMIMDGLRATDD